MRSKLHEHPDTAQVSSQELLDRVSRRFTATMILANGVGAVLVAVYLVLVLPLRHAPPFARTLSLDWPAFAAYLIGASILTPRVGRRLSRARLEWLLQEREPTAAEMRRALRALLVQISLIAGLWLMAAVLFGVLGLRFSVNYAASVSLAVGLGGVVTTAVAYLLGERALRPMTVRVLEYGVPLNAVGLGVISRTVLAWAMATGVALMSVGDEAIGMLDGSTPLTARTAWSLLFLVVVGLCVGALTMIVAAKSVAEPIRAIRRTMADVEEGRLDVRAPVLDASEVGLLQAGFNRMVAGLRERERLRDLFGRHVGETVARRALEEGTELGGQVREAAVLFVDVVGSTALAAQGEPQAVVARLNEFFALVNEVVCAHGGWLNKFEGDAALCVFGVPEPLLDPATRALAAARELARRLEREGALPAAVGVSAGEVVAGNLGTPERFEYTVIGDAVNEAARLSELAKGHRPRLLVSGRAVAAAGPEEAGGWELGDAVTLRGRRAPTVLGVPAHTRVASSVAGIGG